MEPREAVVLITGASSGIGRATALAFDRAGARVAIAARRLPRLEKLAGEMHDALVVRTDLSVDGEAEAMVAKTIDHFGRLDVLVNNAGAAAPRSADRLRAETTRALLETNLVGAMIATRLAAEQMRKQGYGHVINVCSPAGLLGIPLMADYGASKAAMSGWTRSLQAEWKGSGIEVTEVLPGLIATELGQPDRDDGDPPAAARIGPLSPLPPERLAARIVACVRRPRQVVYSDPGARLATWLSYVPRVRLAIGAAIARAAGDR